MSVVEDVDFKHISFVQMLNLSFLVDYFDNIEIFCAVLEAMKIKFHEA